MRREREFQWSLIIDNCKLNQLVSTISLIVTEIIVCIKTEFMLTRTQWSRIFSDFTHLMRMSCLCSRILIETMSSQCPCTYYNLSKMKCKYVWAMGIHFNLGPVQQWPDSTRICTCSACLCCGYMDVYSQCRYKFWLYTSQVITIPL